MKRSTMAAAGLVALLVVGCSDVEGPDMDRTPRISPVLTPRAQTPPTTADLSARKWFEIEFDVGATIKPGEPITIDVTYTSNFSTDDADLRVTLPEVESAKLTDWGGGYKPVLGVPLEAKIKSNRAFGPGDQVSESIVFSVETAGIYRVHGTAISKMDRPDETDERVQPVAHASVWILADEEGGRVLEGGFDPDLVPEGFRSQPGPFVEIDTGETKPEADASGLASSVSCSSSVVCFQTFYYDDDLWGHRYLPGVGYEYSMIHELSPNPITGSGQADALGRFEITCPAPAADGGGTVQLNDSRVRIEPNTWSSLPDFDRTDCGEWLQAYVPSDEGRVWLAAWGAINRSRDRFPSRSRVLIRVNHEDGNDQCVYRAGPDLIDLAHSSTNDCIWSRYGFWVVAHEYGHALHEEQLGGIPSVGSECNPHRPGMDSGLACAYAEGWANYHATITYSTPFTAIPGPNHYPMTLAQIEANPYSGEGGYDGSVDEGQVAAFLYDLTDEFNTETHDNLTIDTHDLARVMGNCRVNQGAWRRPDGIDHLIWCLENRVDSQITGNAQYFPERDTHPTSENQGTHSWAQYDVRINWLKNLYNVTG